MISNILKKIKKFFKRKFPKWQANRLYKKKFNRSIKWSNPTEFNEILRWIQFNTDTTLWTLLADKYRVRDYLKKQGYEDLLVNLYGVWESAEDIDFSMLPVSFVLKTNHGSGSVYVVKDKNKTNLESIRLQLSKDLNETYGIETAEPHYLRIKPCIIAEEMLVPDDDKSTSLIDYKFYCVSGVPQFCGVMFNRDINNHSYDVRLYDNEWNDISQMLSTSAHKGKNGITCPKNFNAMKEFCRKVCKEFLFVRMDFYECCGKLYFGEFTFTPAACDGGSIGPEAAKLLAKELILDY